MEKHYENQTVEFLKFINDVWKMLNVNWVEKNIYFNDNVSAPLAEILKLYSGSSHTILIHLACATMELEHCIYFEAFCTCSTVFNCSLSNKVRPLYNELP